METKKFNSNEKARGGKNNTRTVLTASGISAAVGVATGATAAHLFGIKPKPDKDEENTQAQNNVNQEAQHAEAQQQQQQTQPQTTSNDNITSPQPIDSTGGSGTLADNNNENVQQQQTQSSEEDVDPDLIAQQIAGAVETDPYDIEYPDLLSIDGLDLAYGPDGSEYTVAMVHTPDGGEYMLADIDGDGIFSDVFDLSGNFVGMAEGELTLSDIEEAADPTGGYLAYRDEPGGEDPTEDIIPTSSTQPGAQQDTNDPLMASNDENLVNVDELLAQLMSNTEDDSSVLASREVVVDDTSDDPGDDTSDDESEDDSEEDFDNDEDNE